MYETHVCLYNILFFLFFWTFCINKCRVCVSAHDCDCFDCGTELYGYHNIKFSQTNFNSFFVCHGNCLLCVFVYCTHRDLAWNVAFIFVAWMESGMHRERSWFTYKQKNNIKKRRTSSHQWNRRLFAIMYCSFIIQQWSLCKYINVALYTFQFVYSQNLAHLLTYGRMYLVTNDIMPLPAMTVKGGAMWWLKIVK